MKKVELNGSIDCFDGMPSVAEQKRLKFYISEDTGKLTQGVSFVGGNLKDLAGRVVKTGNGFHSMYNKAIGVVSEAFARRTNKNVIMKFCRIKKQDRVEQKLKEIDMNGDPRNILDIVRGTVVFDSLEDIIQFLHFAETYKIEKKELLDYAPNVGVRDGFVEIRGETQALSLDLKRCDGRLVNDNNVQPPLVNVFQSNGFNIKNLDKVDKRYRNIGFLKENGKPKPTNYSDLKFYTVFPMENKQYYVCETIAAVKRFDDVYGPTHLIMDERRLVQEKIEKEKDIKEQTRLKNYDTVLKAYLTNIHLKVIELYNTEHKGQLNLGIYTDPRTGSRKNSDAVSKMVSPYWNDEAIMNDYKHIKDEVEGLLAKTGDKAIRDAVAKADIEKIINYNIVNTVVGQSNIIYTVQQVTR